MAIVQETPAGVVVLPTAGPPGVSIVGPQGATGGVGPVGAQGRPGDQGPAGAGSLIARTATADVLPWTAIVADGVSGCRPADPSDPAQRQQVIAVTATGGVVNAIVQAQNTGDLTGTTNGFVAGMTLFVGPGGALVPDPPTSGWRQAVGSVIADGHIVVNLGEATLLADDVVMVAATGFSTPASASDVAAGQDSTKFVTPATLAPALASKASASAIPPAASSTEVAAGQSSAKFVSPAALAPSLAGKANAIDVPGAAASGDVAQASAVNKFLSPARLGDVAAPGNPVGDALAAKALKTDVPAAATADDVAQPSVTTRYLTPARLANVAVPGNPVGDAIGARATAANASLTGVSSHTGSGPLVDLIKVRPANGTWTSATGAPIQAEPALGPFNGTAQDLTRAQTVRYFSPIGDSNKGEYGTLLNMVSNAGFPSNWAPNTAYPQNGTCLNDGGKMYRVKDGTTGGTSASSGPGPIGTGDTITDGSVTWRYEPRFTPGNGGKSNLTVMTYQDAGSGAAWSAAFDQQIAQGGYKKNSFTVEIDLNNHWGDYNNPPFGPSAVALQIFTGGPYRSNAGISIGQYEPPSISAYALVNGIQVGGDTLVSDNTFADYTKSNNGIANFGHHPGSSFTDGSDSPISFNSYGGAVIGFRHAGTSVIGLKLEGSYTAFQIQGPGWNVNGSGTVTATGVVTSNGFAFATDGTQDIGTPSGRARNLYLANNPIVSSDQSLKTTLAPFTDAQMEAWGKIQFGLFQYLAAVAEKGADHARWHAGVIAQQVVAALGADAFRYGVVGRDLLWKTVTKTRKVQAQKFEPVEMADMIDVVENGRAIRRAITRTEQRPVFEQIPLWHEDGSPVMIRRIMVGQDGRPVPTHLPEAGLDGEMVMRPRPEAEIYEPIQATYSRAAMVEMDEEYAEEVPDLDEAGGHRFILNIRYDQLSVWEAAYQRHLAYRTEARLTALEKA